MTYGGPSERMYDSQMVATHPQSNSASSGEVDVDSAEQTHLHHDIEQQDNVINSFGYNCDFLFHCPDIAFRLFEQF